MLKSRAKKTISQIISLGLISSLAIATSLSSPSVSVAAEWKTIQKRGRLVIGVKNNLPPLGFVDAKGELAGFEIDIAKELAKELLGSETALELRVVSNHDRLNAVGEDRVDIAIAQLTVSQNRARLVDFTLPYYTDGTALIAKQGTSLAQLQQAKISVLKGSDAIAALQYYFPKAIAIGADSYQKGLAALQAGKVDAFAGDQVAIAAWLREHPEFTQVGEKISAKNWAIALPKGLQYEELRQKVNSTVGKWRKNGWLEQRAKFWGLN